MRPLILSAILCTASAGAAFSCATDANSTFRICEQKPASEASLMQELASCGWAPMTIEPSEHPAIPRSDPTPEGLAFLYWFLIGPGNTNGSLSDLRYLLETELSTRSGAWVLERFHNGYGSLLEADGALLSVRASVTGAGKTVKCNYIGPASGGDDDLLRSLRLPYRNTELMRWVRIPNDESALPFLGGFAATGKTRAIGRLFGAEIPPVALFSTWVYYETEEAG